jgi:hypothetical protein
MGYNVIIGSIDGLVTKIRSISWLNVLMMSPESHASNHSIKQGEEHDFVTPLATRSF